MSLDITNITTNTDWQSTRHKMLYKNFIYITLLWAHGNSVR